jgi:predicted metal-dependent enzyme (double-stranded beta helix superfamily)
MIAALLHRLTLRHCPIDGHGGQSVAAEEQLSKFPSNNNRHAAMTSTTTSRLPAFESLIQKLRHAWASVDDIETRMRHAEIALKDALSDPAIVAHSKQWPWTPGQNLLLYEDLDHPFVINATVRKPGSKGQVHDHGHSWTLYGLVDGTERIERYARKDDGKRAGFAELMLVAGRDMGPGGVDFVPPYEVHAERGGADRSVAIIVRSERMVGRFKQHMFDVDNKTVTEAWGPEQVPFELA